MDPVTLIALQPRPLHMMVGLIALVALLQQLTLNYQPIANSYKTFVQMVSRPSFGCGLKRKKMNKKTQTNNARCS